MTTTNPVLDSCILLLLLARKEVKPRLDSLVLDDELLLEQLGRVAANLLTHLGHEEADVDVLQVGNLALVDEDVGRAIIVLLEITDVSSKVLDVVLRDLNGFHGERLTNIGRVIHDVLYELGVINLRNSSSSI